MDNKTLKACETVLKGFMELDTIFREKFLNNGDFSIESRINIDENYEFFIDDVGSMMFDTDELLKFITELQVNGIKIKNNLNRIISKIRYIGDKNTFRVDEFLDIVDKYIKALNKEINNEN